MELLFLSGLASLGYYLNKEEREKNNKLKNKNIVTENEKPSSDNIYSSRFLEKVQEKEFALATQNYKDSENPLKTGIVNGDTFKKRQGNKYEIGEDLIQEENEIIKETIDSTTKFPESSNSVLDTSFGLLDNKKVEEFGIKKYNEKRNKMEEPSFEIIPDNENIIFKTVKNGKYGKGINIYEKGHNNMEPFFGSAVKQNMDKNVNKTLLENFTGTDVIYKHKKETKLFFKPEKNEEVNGQKIIRNDDRYIPSIGKNNILPFEQIKVTKGLNKSVDELSTNVGFHDDYRPLGQGKYKTVDELRVKPKLTYKGRYAGEKHYIDARGYESKVASNKSVDRYLTNFKPDEKEGFTNDVRYREIVPNKSAVGKTTDLNIKSIVLKEAERNKYTEEISKFKGIIKKGFGIKTSIQDDAKITMKEQTENNKYKYTNTYSEVNKNQINPYDIAKMTIKEQTEDNNHKYTNTYGEINKNQMNPYDEAKTTIKQQTEDNNHKYLNTNGNKRRINDYSDNAKTTIKEQTELRTYLAPKGSSETNGQQTNRYNYYNAEINALKEQTINRREPVLEGTKIGPEKEQYNVDTKKTQFTTYNFTKHVEPTIKKSNDKYNIGNFTRQKQIYDHDINNDRINSVYVEQFKKNPYTQSLSSYIIPYNPKSVER